MTIGGNSIFSNSLSILDSIIQEANEPPYITQQKAARGDPEAIRKLDRQQAQQELLARLQHLAPQGDISEVFDLFA